MSRWIAVALLVSLAGCRAAASADRSLAIELAGDLFAEGDPSPQGWLSIAPRLTRSLSPRLLLILEPVLEADSHGDLDRGRLYDDDDRGRRRAPLRFDRLSLRVDLGAVKLEIGKQPLTWGRTDAINPTDNLTPRDWTDPLREIRLAPWALRVNVETGRWEGEAALVPRYAPSRLPDLGGRWAPIEPRPVANPAFPFIGPPELQPAVGLAEPRFPASTLDNVQAGVRLGRRGGRTEWALSYYRGFDDAPRFDLSVGVPEPGAATVPILLEPRFPRLEVVGADGVLLAGAWALRAEAGHFRFPEDLDDDFLLYELDAEWTRGDWRLVAGYADLSVTARAAMPRATGGDLGGTGGTPDIASLDLAFLPAAFVHLGRAVATEWELSLEALIGTEQAGSLIQISGSWPAGDTLRLGAEIDLLSGDADSLFGVWRANDRLRVFARISS